MILSDLAIRNAMIDGEIIIEPFDPAALGGNSYDVHLSKHFMVYERERDPRFFGLEPLDVKRPPLTREFEINDKGFVLMPGVLYLASTIEYTETHRHVPYLDGKSSIGRLGIFTHVTAGRGDVGFRGHWTLEICVVGAPVRIYPGIPIGQLTFHKVEGAVQRAYDTKTGAKYTDAADPRPQPSRMWKNFKE